MSLDEDLAEELEGTAEDGKLLLLLPQPGASTTILCK